MIKFLLFLFSVGSLQAQELNPLFFRQWALVNTGQSIFIRESDLNFPAQPGISGMDINYVDKNKIESRLGRNLSEVIVAVIDTGVDITHEDLAGRIWKDENGKFGKNFLSPAQEPTDDKGHGTHVAGIIAANDNRVGILGTASSNIKIMPLKVLNRNVNSFSVNGNLISDIFADAIEYAVDNGADIINMSVGFPQLVLTKKFRDAIKKAHDASIPIIVAAGNNRKDLPVFPCNLATVICVGSVDNAGSYSVFSNYGQAVDIVAPGESIVSTFPMNLESRRLRIAGYEKMKGTSQAAPFIAGIAAMIKATHPSESIDQLMARLLCTTKKINSKDEKFSLFGMVNMQDALLKNLPNCLTLNFKERSQVVINSPDLSFEYELELKNFTGNHDLISIEVAADSRINLEKHTFHLANIKSGESSRIKLIGKFINLDADSNVPFNFKVIAGNKEYQFKANLSFSLGSGAVAYRNFTLDAENPSDIYLKREQRRFSLLSYVYSATNKKLLSEYFYKVRSSRKPIYGFIRITQGEVQSLRLELEQNQRLINLIKGNFGKGHTYIALIQDPKTKTYTLKYMNNDFHQSENFTFVDSGALINLESPINREGNLLNFHKRMVNFEWIKNNGILTPIITQEGLLPTIDNSDDLLDFESPGLAVRKYALIPNSNNELIPRSLLSVNRRAEIREQLYYQGLQIDSWENIRIENVLINPQTKNETLEYLLSVGEFYERRYFRYKLSSLKSYELIPLHSIGAIISGNTSFPQIDATAPDIKPLTTYRLIERDTGRLAYTDTKTGETHIQPFQTDGYEDPVFGFISGLKLNGAYSAFIESRYWIHFFGGQDSHFKYPVNRESSFPGVQFSETMEPVQIDNRGVSNVGIFVNSTLLYGNQVHVIAPNAEELIRPLRYTIEVPNNCAYMLPGNFNNRFDSLVFNCLEGGKSKIKIIDLTQ